MGCVQLSETFAVTRKKAHFSFSSDSFLVRIKNIRKASFDATKIAAYANKFGYACS